MASTKRNTTYDRWFSKLEEAYEASKAIHDKHCGEDIGVIVDILFLAVLHAEHFNEKDLIRFDVKI